MPHVESETAVESGGRARNRLGRHQTEGAPATTEESRAVPSEAHADGRHAGPASPYLPVPVPGSTRFRFPDDRSPAVAARQRRQLAEAVESGIRSPYAPLPPRGGAKPSTMQRWALGVSLFGVLTVLPEGYGVGAFIVFPVAFFLARRAFIRLRARKAIPSIVAMLIAVPMLGLSFAHLPAIFA